MTQLLETERGFIEADVPETGQLFHLRRSSHEVNTEVIKNDGSTALAVLYELTDMKMLQRIDLLMPERKV